VTGFGFKASDMHLQTRYQFWNPSVATPTHFAKKDLINRKLSDLIGGFQSPEVRKEIIRFLYLAF
jgi:hypothetical protein